MGETWYGFGAWTWVVETWSDCVGEEEEEGEGTCWGCAVGVAVIVCDYVHGSYSCFVGVNCSSWEGSWTVCVCPSTFLCSLTLSFYVSVVAVVTLSATFVSLVASVIV